MKKYCVKEGDTFYIKNENILSEYSIRDVTRIMIRDVTRIMILQVGDEIVDCKIIEGYSTGGYIWFYKDEFNNKNFRKYRK
jgi:hypothetical protein